MIYITWDVMSQDPDIILGFIEQISNHRKSAKSECQYVSTAHAPKTCAEAKSLCAWPASLNNKIFLRAGWGLGHSG